MSMEDAKAILAWLPATIWGKTRKWSEFVGGFSRPDVSAGWKSLEQRLQANFRFYKANYIVIVAVLSAYKLITNWWLLFALLLAGGAYAYLFHVRKVPLVLNGRLVTARQKLVVWAAASALLLFLVGAFWTFLWVVIITGVVVMVHATFRTPTRMQMDANSSKLHGLFDSGAGSDDENLDEEAGVNGDEGDEIDADGAGGLNRGPLPGTVETRHRKNEEYMARRQRLQNKYPNLHYQ